MYLWSKGIQELFVQHILFEGVLIFRYFTEKLRLKPTIVDINPLTPMSDQDRISPYNINTMSTS